jgi:hypothetical protein
LAVKLELSGDDGVLAPAVHIQRGFREDECSGIRDTRVIVRVRASTINGTGSNSSSVQRRWDTTKVGFIVRIGRSVPISSEASIKLSGDVVKSTCIIEKAVGINVSTGISSN